MTVSCAFSGAPHPLPLPHPRRPRPSHIPRRAPAARTSVRRRGARRVSSCSSAAPSAERVFIYGVGYVGLKFALAMRDQGAHVSGTTRSPERAQALLRLGIETACVDAYDCAPDSSSRLFFDTHLSAASHVVSTLPPAASPSPFPFLSATKLSKPPPWLCYLSSTSVYGDHAGNIVTESSRPLSPSSTGAARLAAECAATAAADASRLCVLRLAGIYGPSRSALDTLLARPVGDMGGQKLVSRVHVDDIVCAMVAAAEMRAAGVYNVADNVPASREEVFRFAQGLLRAGAAGPVCRDRLRYLEGLASKGDMAPQKPSRRDRERTSKRVDNAKMRRELVEELEFRSYREGIAKIAADYAAAPLPGT